MGFLYSPLVVTQLFTPQFQLIKIISAISMYGLDLKALMLELPGGTATDILHNFFNKNNLQYVPVASIRLKVDRKVSFSAHFPKLYFCSKIRYDQHTSETKLYSIKV